MLMAAVLLAGAVVWYSVRDGAFRRSGVSRRDSGRSILAWVAP